MSIRLCQLQSKGCAWFPGNKGHCTRLPLSWRVWKRNCERRSCPPLIGSGGTMCCLHDASALCFKWLYVRHCMSLCIWQIIWQVKDYSNLLCYSSGSWEGSAYHMCCVILASVSIQPCLSVAFTPYVILWFKTGLLLTVYSDLNKIDLSNRQEKRFNCLFPLVSWGWICRIPLKWLRREANRTCKLTFFLALPAIVLVSSWHHWISQLSFFPIPFISLRSRDGWDELCVRITDSKGFCAENCLLHSWCLE